jgi:hypothetical protein
MPANLIASPMQRKMKAPISQAKLMGTREMNEEQYVERRLVTKRANAMPK